MKIQDIGFFIILLALVFFKRNPKWFVVAGLVCLTLSMPLFHFWIFFTAQRFIEYGAAFLFIAIILSIIRKEK
jgi:thiamine transporter ThiT